MVGSALPAVSGYALRTHHLVRAQRKVGIEASVLVVQKHPEILRFHKVLRGGVGVQYVDEVPYLSLTEPRVGRRIFVRFAGLLRRMGIPSGVRFGSKSSVLRESWDSLVNRVTDCVSVDIVHAHTPPSIAEIGLRLARRMGLPLIYEVRGFWDLSAESAGRYETDGVSVEEYRRRETRLLAQATHVVTLSGTMRDYLVERGVPYGRISIVGNGANSETSNHRFAVSQERTLPDDTEYVVGYAGNIRALEGLDVLIHATKLIKERNMRIRTIIVGTGDDLRRLQALSASLSLQEVVHFVGEVPFERVCHYVSAMDVFVVPRLDYDVCRIVSPLKPMDVMLCQKPLVVSNLPALQEFIGTNQRGLGFRVGDREDLAATLTRLYEQPQLRRKLGRAAGTWAARRSWDYWAAASKSIYLACGRS